MPTIQRICLVEPSSLTEFPTTLDIDASTPLTLVGVGVRKVSFLRVTVYAVGFYADLSSLPV